MVGLTGDLVEVDARCLVIKINPRGISGEGRRHICVVLVCFIALLPCLFVGTVVVKIAKNLLNWKKLGKIRKKKMIRLENFR